MVLIARNILGLMVVLLIICFWKPIVAAKSIHGLRENRWFSMNILLQEKRNGLVVDYCSFFNVRTEKTSISLPPTTKMQISSVFMLFCFLRLINWLLVFLDWFLVWKKNNFLSRWLLVFLDWFRVWKKINFLSRILLVWRKRMKMEEFLVLEEQLWKWPQFFADF